MKTEKSNKTRIELSAKELDIIYSALNRLACHYSEKSDTMKKIDGKDPEAAREAILHPDFYFQKWEEVGDIKQRIHMALDKLSK